MDNCILVDWFSMTCKGFTKMEALELLGLPDDINFDVTYGFYGYRSRLCFDGISIHYDHWNVEQDYPMIELTGQGCRDFETYSSKSFNDLFRLALDTEHFHVTRLDVAYDDHSGILDINKIVDDTLNRNFVGKLHNGMIVDSFKREVDAWSVMLGSRSSDLYIRIYDKARERKINDGRHWIRCETVFKQDRAIEFIRNPLPLGEKLRGVLHNYLRFVTPHRNDSNKRRWETRKYWTTFLGSVKSISVYTPKDVEYNLTRLGRYVFKQAGNSIDTYIKCQGLISFLDELLKRGTKLTVHQKSLIEQFRQQMDNKSFISDSFIDDLQSSGVYKL